MQSVTELQERFVKHFDLLTASRNSLDAALHLVINDYEEAMAIINAIAEASNGDTGNDS